MPYDVKRAMVHKPDGFSVPRRKIGLTGEYEKFNPGYQQLDISCKCTLPSVFSIATLQLCMTFLKVAIYWTSHIKTSRAVVEHRNMHHTSKRAGARTRSGVIHGWLTSGT